MDISFWPYVTVLAAIALLAVFLIAVLILTERETARQWHAAYFCPMCGEEDAKRTYLHNDGVCHRCGNRPRTFHDLVKKSRRWSDDIQWWEYKS